MRRTHTLAALFAALTLCAFALTVNAQDDNMVLKNDKAFAGGLQRGPVKFSHGKHTMPVSAKGYGVEDCQKCHHKYGKDKKNTWEPGDETSCAACHAGAKPQSTIKLEKAFHQLCWGCHEKPTKEMKYGPRSCAGCHEVK
ncbi:MAG: cytochrome c3 family protein [Thermodesulfobacteriota bacterium]